MQARSFLPYDEFLRPPATFLDRVFEWKYWDIDKPNSEMDLLRLSLLFGVLCGLAVATNLGEKVEVHASEKANPEEKAQNYKRVRKKLLFCSSDLEM